MQETTPTEIHPQETLGVFTPLTRDTYPVFNKYPKFIVDFQVSMFVELCKIYVCILLIVCDMLKIESSTCGLFICISLVTRKREDNERGTRIS